MSEVLNFYLNKYGLLERKIEDNKINSNENAKKRWDILRTSIRSASELVNKDDLKNNKISHGIQFLRRISNHFEIEQAIYLPNVDQYMILDGRSVQFFDSSGRYDRSYSYSEIAVPFSRLQWANVSERFIAWGPGTKNLAMLDGAFKVLAIVEDSLIEDPIFELCYNEDKNEIVSSHTGQLVIWQFRYANKYLIQKKSIQIRCKGDVATMLHFERTQSRDQRMFVVSDCGVFTVRLSDGDVLCEHSQMHDQLITALTFFNPLKLLVTGCMDGSIKVWAPKEKEMELKMVFVGHTAPVTALALFPGGCQATVASCGSDNTLRVWSLDINDEIECMPLDYSPKFIGSDISKISFFTVDRNFVDIWQQNHVLHDLVTLASPATRMDMSLRERTVVVTCKNNLLFTASSDLSCQVITKTVVSSQLLSSLDKKERLKVLSSVLLEVLQVLFVLTNRNLILQYDTRSHPMNLKRRSQCEVEESLLVLALYKVDNEEGSKTGNKSLLMSGSSIGSIIVHDTTEPERMLFKVDAHTGTPVASLLSSTSTSKLFSSGGDNSIKVWHVYPFASESLARELSFYCGHLPTHLANIDHYLFAVFNDVDGAQYPTVVYNLHNRSRYDHSPNDDHFEPVNSVSAATRMKLFMSSSSGMENVVKIWTCKNVLLRQIAVHFPLNCSTFSSDKADILISVGNQISKISHETFLPRSYIKKQVLMHFEDVSPDMIKTTVKFDEEECQKMFKSREREILQGIKAVFEYQNYTDILPDSEAEEVGRRRDVLKKSYARIKSIEDDIRDLQLGKCKKIARNYEKFVENPKETDILKAYVSEFMRFYKITLPEEMVEDFEESRKKRRHEKYRECDKVGFFPSSKSVSKSVGNNMINPSGYIPNSTILNKLWPPELIRDKADVWKPPMLSSLDLALARVKGMTQVEEESPRFFDWGLEEEKEVIESPKSSKEVTMELSEDLLSKFSSILNETETTVEKETNSFESEIVTEVPKRPASTKISRDSLKLPAISRLPATMPELRKVPIRSSPSPLQAEVIKENEILSIVKTDTSLNVDSFFITQPSVEERVKHASVLPEFLLQFASDKWFLKICPLPHHSEACLNTLLKPVNATNFCKQLLQLLQISTDVADLISLVNAFQHLYSQENIERSTVVNIHTFLTNKVNELRQLDSDEKIDLFKTSLKVMVTLEGISDKAVVLICLSRYFDANEELRHFMKSLLCHLGLEDDEDILKKELDNFKLFNVQLGPQRMADLQTIVLEWLQKWHQLMLNFATECRNMIGEEVHLLNSKFNQTSKRVSSCLERVLDIFHLRVANPTDLMQLYPPDKCSKSVLTYINCLNFLRYKIQMKKKKKLKESDDRVASEENEEPRKTIVMLPKLNPNKQCLVRIGESNADKMDLGKRREFSLLNSMWSKSVIADQTQHPAMQPLCHYQIAVGGGFVPYMHLHMKPCLVNPFPRPEDIIEWETINSKSLFLSAKQSFIPQFSLPPEPF